MKTPEGIIFDMDGLMIDSERVTRDGYHEIARQDGFDFDDEFYLTLLGKNVPSIFATFKERYGQDFPIENVFERVHEYIRSRYDAQGVPVKKGLRELVDWANENKIPIVVATSSNRARVDDILKRIGLSEKFDDSICGDEIENGKPNPEIFLKAAGKIGVDPEKALVLEDSAAGLEAARRAGIPSICVIDLQEPENSAHADAVVNSLLDVKELLETKQDKE